jgi:hypothetical protein
MPGGVFYGKERSRRLVRVKERGRKRMVIFNSKQVANTICDLPVTDKIYYSFKFI